MGIKTSIEWADSSTNIQMGCEGCELVANGNVTCYAKLMTDRYKGKNGWPNSFEEPKLFLDRLDKALTWPDLTGTDRKDKPWLNGLPRIIFLNDMGDTFTKGLPEDWFAEVLPKIATSKHQFLVLTKWPKRFVAFSKKYSLPKNVWPGTSVTSNKTVFRAEQLLQVVGGGPKFLSVEPLRTRIKIPFAWNNLDWIIAGGESGSKAAPFCLEWAEEIKLGCFDLGISFFLKQLGTKPMLKGKDYPVKDYHGGDWNEWPDYLRKRKIPLV